MKLKQRKSVANGFRKLREAFEQEDRALRDAQDNNRSRAEKRREEKAARQAEKETRRAEARRLALKEERDLQKNNVPRKLTAVELLMQREKKLKEMEKMAEENAKKQSRVVTEEEYERTVLVANANGRNNYDDSVETCTIEETLDMLMTLGQLKSTGSEFTRFQR